MQGSKQAKLGSEQKKAVGLLSIGTFFGVFVRPVKALMLSER